MQCAALRKSTHDKLKRFIYFFQHFSEIVQKIFFFNSLENLPSKSNSFPTPFENVKMNLKIRAA